MKRRTPRGPKAATKEIEVLDIALSEARARWIAALTPGDKIRAMNHINSLLDERSALAARSAPAS